MGSTPDRRRARGQSAAVSSAGASGLISTVPAVQGSSVRYLGPPIGRFSVAAILAALCSSLCWYGSSNSGGDFKYAARNKLDDTFGTRTLCSSFCRYGLLTRTSGSWFISAQLENVAEVLRSAVPEWAARFLRSSQKRQCGSDCSRLAVSRRIPSDSSSSSSSSDSKFAECKNYEVKTPHRELCSIRARAFNSPHTCAPLPLHCLCDSGRAAAMSGCNGQPGATRTSSELPRQHSCITRGSCSRRSKNCKSEPGAPYAPCP